MKKLKAITTKTIALCKKAAANPTARLAGRAVLAGAIMFVVKLKDADHIDGALLESAAISAGWVAVEIFTPLNALIGKFKQPS